MLRGPYKRNEYRKAILPLTVLRRFDCLLAPTKDQVLEEFKAMKTKPETVVRSLLQKITGRPFYSLSKIQFDKDARHSLLDDPNNLSPNLNSYINGFSKNVRDIIRELLRVFGKKTGQKLYKDREAFLTDLKAVDRERGVHLDVSELKAMLNALGERDETAEICRDRSGNPEPDPELRDTENVPLKESIEAYFKREVLSHVPDAWIDESKTKVGYEIPLNRHFYRYEPPRPLESIEADIKTLEGEIVAMLKEVTA